MPISTPPLSVRFVISMAVLSPLFYWPEYGSMFTAPTIDATVGVTVRAKDVDSATTPSTTTSMSQVVPQVTQQASLPAVCCCRHSDRVAAAAEI